MIDIHCHLIPNIDDGSKELAVSLDQFRRMAAGGITHVFLTSHYFKGHYEYAREDYDTRVAGLRAELANEGINLQLLPGFEVFAQPNILQDIQAKSLFLGDSRYVLVESELNGLPPDFYANVYPMLRAGIRPILAHAERYVSVMKDPESVREFIERNIYIQINAGSLMGQYGQQVRQTAFELINNGWAHFLGSDDHARNLYGVYFAAAELIAEEFDPHMAELLTIKHPQALLSNEKLAYFYVDVQDDESMPESRAGQPHKSLWQRIFG